MKKTKYKGYWIEEIEYNTATLFMFYPIGSKRPFETFGKKALSVKDAKTFIDCLGDNLGDN